MTRRTALIALAIAAALTSGVAQAGIEWDQISREAQRIAEASGARGADLSPLLSSGDIETRALRERPTGLGLATLTSSEPAVRLHVATGHTGAADLDLDGVPDRAARALDVVRRTLDAAARAGLGSFADDGDSELDIYLIPLGGVARGYAAIEGVVPPGPGGAGFGVVDISHAHDEAAFLAMVARVTGRLVLAARDASAPSWWVEPSATWIEERAFGPSVEMAISLQARWSRPELGIDVGAPPVARGNAGLLWSLPDGRTQARALAATWRALEMRDPAIPARDVILNALSRATGARAADLIARAAVQQLVHGLAPLRFSAELDGDTPAGAREPIFVAPLGAALVRVTPGTPEWESTRLLAATGSPDWVSNVLARNRRGGWERVHLESRGSSVSVEIPWSEYSEAALIFVRPEYALGAGELLVRVEGSEGRAPFGLASFGGRAAGGDMVEISWETSWERDIFGWVIERAVEADGPWEFVEPIPAPALGFETRGGRYTIVDHTATAATGPLHYRLVALTRAGLRLTGPSIVVRH